MEACAGAHYMACKLAGFGHRVKLISPQFVRPFVKSNKNDFVDAEAICEAASRPAMRFVTPKTESQQTLSALHRVRDALVRDRTKATNRIHGFLLEFGVSLPIGQGLGPAHAHTTALECRSLRAGEQAGAHSVGAGSPQHRIRYGIGGRACLTNRSRFPVYRSAPTWFCDR